MKFFDIPALDPAATEAELNHFMAEHRVLDVERQFIQHGGNSAWCLCVSYLAAGESPAAAAKPRGRIDYKERLSDTDFAVYSRIRELRKRLAEQDGIPVYSVLNNAQLAAMVEQQVGTLAQMQTIDGVGEARVRKYGQAFLDELARVRAASGDP